MASHCDHNEYRISIKGADFLVQLHVHQLLRKDQDKSHRTQFPTYQYCNVDTLNYCLFKSFRYLNINCIHAEQNSMVSIIYFMKQHCSGGGYGYCGSGGDGHGIGNHGICDCDGVVVVTVVVGVGVVVQQQQQ